MILAFILTSIANIIPNLLTDLVKSIIAKIKIFVNRKNSTYMLGGICGNHEILSSRRKPCGSLASRYNCASRSSLDGSEPGIAQAQPVSCLLLKCSQKFILRLARQAHFQCNKKGMV